MSSPPAQPKIYHITHVDNLPSIIKGDLASNASIIAQGNETTPIGMSSIKHRRLTLPVRCHPGDYVGDYVPFYFCARSIMLFLIYKANPELTYKGGQRPIIHLEADMAAAVEWANREGRRWAFSFSNAGASYTRFSNDLSDLSDIDWPAIANTDFRAREVKEGKQAEFLLYGSVPWTLVSRIGVYSRDIAQQAHAVLDLSTHRPIVEVRSDWYF